MLPEYTSSTQTISVLHDMIGENRKNHRENCMRNTFVYFVFTKKRKYITNKISAFSNRSSTYCVQMSV